MSSLVTLFGGGGFLGRYVARELLQAGARVRIAERDPKRAWFVRSQGGLGQTQFAAADLTRPDSVRRAVQGSDAVINLVGILKGNFDAIHVRGAEAVAQAAEEAGAGAFVQVSAIGADPASPSAYGRSKGEGEAAVRAAFPRATIIRPSIIFGAEDQFVNRFAQLIAMLPVVPVIRGATRFQPAWAGDVARAIAAAALDPRAHGGQVYELGGPETISMLELNRWIAEEIGRSPAIVEVPDEASRLMAKVGDWLPGAPITSDQLRMLAQDNVVAPAAQGFAAFGIAPKPMASIMPRILVQYRRQGRFAKRQSA
ncbi:complex I NDUFA9 subunit family protein [Sphingomonas sp. 1P06PA]|uniref:complex I NDUFA9 subunit family protein n=1 Tax=Sphingomonas sp. 1P06PA TaxID=554121 RepID=UPI0039A6AA60